MSVSLRKNPHKMPVFGQTLYLTIDTTEGEKTFVGTVLDYDDSGQFVLVVWEDGTRDYRYVHWGYDPQMDERMEW